MVAVAREKRYNAAGVPAEDVGEAGLGESVEA